MKRSLIFDENGEVVDSIKEIETVDENKTYDKEDLIIERITPLGFNNVIDPQGQNIGTLSFLAVNKKDEMMVINVNYLFENEHEAEIAKEIPFHDDYCFISQKFINNTLTNHLTSFITDLNFRFNNIEDNEKFSFKAKRIDKEGIHETVEFLISSDVYNSIRFIDNYVFNMVINYHDIEKATLTGFNFKENPSEIFIVDKIDRIISIVPIGEKKSNSVCIEFVVSDKDDNKRILLTTFYTDFEFKKKKFKNMSIESIERNFLVEEDQFLQVFNSFDKFSNIDKEYIIVRGINKDGKTVLFFLDSTVRSELETMMINF